MSKWNFNSANVTNSSLINWITSIFDKKSGLFPIDLLREEFLTFMAVLFNSIWMNRNLITHGGSIPPLQMIFKLIKATSNAHWHSQLKRKITAGTHDSDTWRAPPSNWIKVNSDCRFIDGISHSAFLVRNFNGSITFAQAKHYYCTNALTAELHAIKDACIFMNQAKADRVIFEADSLNAITFINDPSSPIHWSASQLVEEIRRFWALWPKWRFKICSRNSNFAAHNLAAWSFSFKKLGSFPVNLLPVSCFCNGGFPLVDNFYSVY